MPEQNPFKPVKRSVHRPHTSFALTDGFKPRPAPKDWAKYDGCASVMGMAFSEANRIREEERREKEEEKKQLEMIIRQKEIELAALVSHREGGFTTEDLEQLKSATSDLGDVTARVTTSRRATAAQSRSGRTRRIGGGEPFDPWKTSYFEQLCQLPGDLRQQPRNRQFESPQQFELSGMQWRLEKLRELQDADRTRLERTKGMDLPPDPARKFQYGLASLPRGYLFEEVKVNKTLKDLFVDTACNPRFPPRSRHRHRFDQLATDGLGRCLTAHQSGTRNQVKDCNGGGDVIAWVHHKGTHNVHKKAEYKRWAGVNAAMTTYGAKIF